MKPKRRKSQSTAVNVETLEVRQLKTAAISFVGGTLDIKLSGGEHIQVSENAGNVTVKNRSGQVLNSPIRADQVERIHINGSNARDEIFLNEVGNHNFRRLQYTHIQGHRGNDHIVGSNVTDYIFGQGGEDFINGLGGNDKLWGGARDDTIWGGNGSDELYGEGGNDRLYGATANHIDSFFDRLDGGSGRDFAYNVRPEDQLISVRRRS